MTTQKKHSNKMATDSKDNLMGLEEIEILLETLEKHEVTEFRLEREGEKVWLKRGAAATQPQPFPMMVPQYNYSGYAPSPVTSDIAGVNNVSTQQTSKSAELSVVPGSAPSGTTSSETLKVDKNLKEIRSPMVGTFYRRPAVDAEPYVKVGDSVKKGDVLCIVEAMKLMNEIESDVSGRIAEICLEDGQMVEYGEILFKIEAS